MKVTVNENLDYKGKKIILLKEEKWRCLFLFFCYMYDSTFIKLYILA